VDRRVVVKMREKASAFLILVGLAILCNGAWLAATYQSIPVLEHRGELVLAVGYLIEVAGIFLLPSEPPPAK
jgi:hypothetical protein